MNYWNGKDYLGIGPGSASRLSSKELPLQKIRYAIKQIMNPNQWINSILSNAPTLSRDPLGALEFVKLSVKENIEEILLCGLRKVDGLSESIFKENTGIGFYEVRFKSEEINVLGN